MRIQNDSIIMLLVAILVLYLLFYIFYKNNINKFIGKLNKKLYIYSILICGIGFFITLLYILLKNDFTNIEQYHIFLSMSTMIRGLNLWIISSHFKIISLNILFLLSVVISNIFLLYYLVKLKETTYIFLHSISIISVSYLLFHNFFIDLILWNYCNYFMK